MPKTSYPDVFWCPEECILCIKRNFFGNGCRFCTVSLYNPKKLKVSENETLKIGENINYKVVILND